MASTSKRSANADLDGDGYPGPLPKNADAATKALHGMQTAQATEASVAKLLGRSLTKREKQEMPNMIEATGKKGKAAAKEVADSLRETHEGEPSPSPDDELDLKPEKEALPIAREKRKNSPVKKTRSPKKTSKPKAAKPARRRRRKASSPAPSMPTLSRAMRLPGQPPR